MTELEKRLEEKQKEISKRIFPDLRRKEAKNPETLKSVIKKYHQIYYAGTYPFGANLIPREMIMRLRK